MSELKPYQKKNPARVFPFAERFVPNFIHAQANGLEYEFVEWLFEDLPVTVRELDYAIVHSKKEWTL